MPPSVLVICHCLGSTILFLFSCEVCRQNVRTVLAWYNESINQLDTTNWSLANTFEPSLFCVGDNFLQTLERLMDTAFSHLFYIRFLSVRFVLELQLSGCLVCFFRKWKSSFTTSFYICNSFILAIMLCWVHKIVIPSMHGIFSQKYLHKTAVCEAYYPWKMINVVLHFSNFRLEIR